MPETVPAGVQGIENDRAYPFARLHTEPASTSPNRFALRLRDPHVDAHVAIRLGLIDSMTIIGVGSRTVRASRVLVAHVAVVTLECPVPGLAICDASEQPPVASDA